jgi:MFS family permease
LLAAALGLTYGIASMIGGRFAQRRGYFTALKAGNAILAIVLGVGAFVQALPIHLAIMFAAMFGMALTWPALEALISEGPRHELPRNIGIYNLVWAGLGAVAYFCGGAIFEATSFRAMFFVPAVIHGIQFFSTLALERAASRGANGGSDSPIMPGLIQNAGHERSPVGPETFLRMAWLANPFAYLAINTVIALTPALANRLHLTVVQAGVFCSIWLFMRTLSFLGLWLWPGWHYRFRWLVGAYVMMTVSFVAMLLATHLWIVIAAQVALGLALGLIYYSSLYYSMDVGDTKGEHGGLHEAMIGAGNCAGPALGATALYLFPNHPSSSTWAVMVLLSGGLAGLAWLRFKTKRD